MAPEVDEDRGGGRGTERAESWELMVGTRWEPLTVWVPQVRGLQS